MTATPYTLLSIADLAALPAPTWQIDGILPAGAFVTLYGPPDVGKSFLALDWALCIAAGAPWYGRQVQQGPVLYIAAEGVAALYQRVAAWQTARNLPEPTGIHFIGGAVNFLSQDDNERITVTLATMAKPPRAIFIDTMARSMAGGDENSARDVGLFIAELDTLAHPYQALRFVVHHSGYNADHERGSSALRGASDTTIAAKPDGASIRLTCERQKDAEKFEPWTLHLQEVGKSCVLRCGTHSGAIGPAERDFLESVSSSFGTQWATATAMAQTFTGARSTYYRVRTALIDGGYLELEDDSRTPRSRITALGLERVSPSPNESQETRQTSLISPLSLEGETETQTETENGKQQLEAQDLDALIAEHEALQNGGQPSRSFCSAATAETRTVVTR
jgi:hypothetical protein